MSLFFFFKKILAVEVPFCADMLQIKYYTNALLGNTTALKSTGSLKERALKCCKFIFAQHNYKLKGGSRHVEFEAIATALALM